MNLTDEFKEIIKNVAMILKEHGYTKRGNTFYKRRDGNWAILNFQRSRANTKENIQFTLNIGIASQAIWRFLGDEERMQDTPRLYECQWRQRIGAYIANGHDFWWKLNETTDVHSLFQEIKRPLVKQVLPTIEAHLSDDQLLDLWLSDRGPIITKEQRLIYAIILFNKKGMIDQVAIRLQELESTIEGPRGEFWLKRFKRELFDDRGAVNE